MNILLALSAVLGLASCTFVNLNDQGATLRRHYHAILRYTTLHHFSKDVRSRIDQAQSRADPIGHLARTLLDLERSAADDYRNRLAFSSFYHIVKGMQVEEMRKRMEQVWATTFHEIHAISPCQHCKQVLERIFEEQSRGGANVHGSRWGKGSLAGQILDKPSLCCFKKKKELRTILRKMEVELVKMYLQGLPKRLRRSTLKRAYQRELDAMQKALSTPLKKESNAMPEALPILSQGESTHRDQDQCKDQDHHQVQDHQHQHHHKHKHDQQQQQDHIEARFDNKGPDSPRPPQSDGHQYWQSWLVRLKSAVKHRKSCVKECDEQATQEAQAGPKSETTPQKTNTEQPESKQQQQQLLRWLRNVKQMLTSKMNQTQEHSHGDEHFVAQSDNDQKDPLAGAVIEEERVVQH